MIFREITKTEYDDFWKKSEQQSFLSSSSICGIDETVEIFYVGVEEKGKIIAASILRGYRRHFGWKSFYVLRGPLMDYGNEKLVKFFAKELKEFLRKKNGYVVKIDPYVELLERDIDGKIVDGGYNNAVFDGNLKEAGFLKTKYVHNVSQIEWMFVTELTGEDEQSLLKKMKVATRGAIKHAEEWGITVRDLKRDELDKFYEVERQTAERRNFGMREIDYYKKMYDLYGDDVSFVVAELNPKECLARIQRKYDDAVVRKNNGEKNKKLEDEIYSLEVRLEKVKGIFKNPKDETIVLSAGMFMTTKTEIVYFVGGNIEKYMKLGGQYLIQWEMIKRAMQNKCARYNFYGIASNIDTHPENYGVYGFKKGFSGKVVQLIGEYELPIDKKKYYTMKIFEKLRRLI